MVVDAARKWLPSPSPFNLFGVVSAMLWSGLEVAEAAISKVLDLLKESARAFRGSVEATDVARVVRSLCRTSHDSRLIEQAVECLAGIFEKRSIGDEKVAPKVSDPGAATEVREACSVFLDVHKSFVIEVPVAASNRLLNAVVTFVRDCLLVGQYELYHVLDFAIPNGAAASRALRECLWLRWSAEPATAVKEFWIKSADVDSLTPEELKRLHELCMRGILPAVALRDLIDHRKSPFLARRSRSII